jgi:hypothetical protein
MPLTNGSGSRSESCYFRHWPTNKKLISKKVFLLITFWRYTYIIFKDKKSKRSHKTVGIKVFFLILLDDGRIRSRSRNRIHTSDKWIQIRIREAQKHVDPETNLILLLCNFTIRFDYLYSSQFERLDINVCVTSCFYVLPYNTNWQYKSMQYIVKMCMIWRVLII